MAVTPPLAEVSALRARTAYPSGGSQASACRVWCSAPPSESVQPSKCTGRELRVVEFDPLPGCVAHGCGIHQDLADEQGEGRRRRAGRGRDGRQRQGGGSPTPRRCWSRGDGGWRGGGGRRHIGQARAAAIAGRARPDADCDLPAGTAREPLQAGTRGRTHAAGSAPCHPIHLPTVRRQEDEAVVAVAEIDAGIAIDGRHAAIGGSLRVAGEDGVPQRRQPASACRVWCSAPPSESVQPSKCTGRELGL